MALDTEMRLSLRGIAHAVRTYSADHGIFSESVQMFDSVEENWSVLELLVILPVSNDRLESAWRDLRRALGDACDSQPRFAFSSVTLVVRSFDQVAEGGLHGIPPGFFEFDLSADRYAITSTVPGSSID